MTDGVSMDTPGKDAGTADRMDRWSAALGGLEFDEAPEIIAAGHRVAREKLAEWQMAATVAVDAR